MSEKLVFNGINGLTGDYLASSATLEEVAEWATGTTVSDASRRELGARQLVDFPVKHGVDPNDLAQSGWAVVFPYAADGSPEAIRQAAIREALQPLLDHRRAMATRQREHRYREIVGVEGWRSGESKREFLSRMGAGTSGPVDPERFPYYVLLVGSPADIPYREQYLLDVQYGVGRIHFEDLSEYAAYARTVVEVETGAPQTTPTAAFFAVENVDDPATYASRTMLTEPLVSGLRDALDPASPWQFDTYLADAATKQELSSLLGKRPPALLFTASHGVGFNSGSASQRACQGAILCQDFPGVGVGALHEDHYFAGRDIATSADLRGLISFHFACYGLGTPRYDNFAAHAGNRRQRTARQEIAPQPFVAELPRRMLGRERGALACIGHVDRAWSSSFLQAAPAGRDGVDTQITTFESTFQHLLAGHRVGLAMDDFNLRYAELTSELATVVEGIQKYDERAEPRQLARLWLYALDARNYAVFGDPAVRIGTAPEHMAQRLPAPAPTPGRVQLQPQPSQAAGESGMSASGLSAEQQFPLLHPAQDDDPSGSARVTRRIATALERIATGTAAFEVQTFVGDPAGARAAVDNRPGQAVPRAFTRCTMDGDTVVSLPVDDSGQIDAQVWRFHREAVAQALECRRHLLDMALSVLPEATKTSTEEV